MLALSRVPLIVASELTPMQMSHADALESWHLPSRGLTLGSQLRASGTSPPAVTISGNLAQSLGLVIKTGAGARGVATYAAYIDGGTTPFQTGTTAASVNLALISIDAAFTNATYSADNVYVGVVGQWANQSPKTRTLVTTGVLTEAPIIEWQALNGRPAIKSLGTNQPHLFDATSNWAATLGAGSFTWMTVAKTADASPSSIRAFLGLGNSADADSLWSLEIRGPSFLTWEVTKTGDSGSSDLGKGADNALDTSWHAITAVQTGDTIDFYVGGTLAFTDSLSVAGSATFDTVSFLARKRAGAASGALVGSIAETLSWSAALTTGERQEHEARLRSKWGV